MKLLNRATLIAMGLTVFVQPATADITDALDSMFMTTGNEPSIYQSQRRMGVDLGYLRLRAPISTINLVNLSPPTLRGGCGGIDLYGGSFSFINEEQFRQMLRQIGANALGYAFKLALASMCEKCDSIMTGLQSIVNDLNSMQVDTCKWAAGAVNTFTDAMDFKVKENAKIKGSLSGAFTDTFEATLDLFQNPDEALAQGDASGADIGNRPEVGNYTFNALIVAGAGAKFNFVPGNIPHNDLLMNIAGTYILAKPIGADAGKDTIKPILERRLTYEELKRGKIPDATGAGDLTNLWICDEPVQCLRPTTPATWSFEGVDAWVADKLNSAAAHMANPATVSTDHTPPLQNFLATLPLTVVRHMQVLQGDANALRIYVDHIDDYVAAAYASSLALAMADVIRTSYGRNDTPVMPEHVEQNLLKFEADATADQREVEKQFAKIWREAEQIVADHSVKHGEPASLLKPKT